MPAKLKAFWEQTLRPDFVSAKEQGGLRDTSVRIVITMGMPAFIYRWYFGAHGLKNLQRNILKFCGAKPVEATLIGGAEGLTPAKAEKWLAKMGKLGAVGK